MEPDFGMFLFKPFAPRESKWEKILRKEVYGMIEESQKTTKKIYPKITKFSRISIKIPTEDWDNFKEAVSVEQRTTNDELTNLIRGYNMRREIFDDE